MAMSKELQPQLSVQDETRNKWWLSRVCAGASTMERVTVTKYQTHTKT